MPAEFAWFDVVEEDGLQQGDILRKCLAPLPPRRADDPHANQPEAEPSPEYDRVVVMTQSCDLIDGEVGRVMVCPLWTLAELIDAELPNAGKNKRDSLKSELMKGRRIGYQLINRCSINGYEAPHLVADFGEAFSIPLDYAKSLIRGGGKRVRILPPYREHLAQGFARFYMRVGLPISIDPFDD